VKEINVAGHLVVEHEQDVRDGDKAFRNYERWSCVDKTLYVLAAVWPTGRPKPVALGRIVNSFRFISK
jgi:hypothetical protein